MPKSWTDDPRRLKTAYAPGDVGFSTKPQLAAKMIARAIAARVPFAWVAGDSVYGVGDIERDLRQAGKGCARRRRQSLVRILEPKAVDQRLGGRDR